MARKRSRPYSPDEEEARSLESLFWKWLEFESIELCPPSRNMPPEGYLWQKDRLGRYHHGCLNLATGRLVPLQSSFNLISSNVPQRYVNTRIVEFGVIFRGMEDFDQGLIIMDMLAGEDEWREYLMGLKLLEKLAKRRLDQIWFYLLIQSRRRRLV